MDKPFKIHPYDVMVSIGCPWIADVKKRVLKRIDEFEDFINKEAASTGIPYFVEEDFIYERFVDNRKHNMAKANLEVLKFFALKFRIKILYDMIGEWKLTDNDAEMYEYFRTTEDFGYLGKGIVTTMLRYAGGKAPNICVHDNTCNWMIRVGNESEFYSNFFYHEIVLISDIVRNVKGNHLIMPDRSFFDGGHLHEGLNLSEHMDFEEYMDLRVYLSV